MNELKEPGPVMSDAEHLLWEEYHGGYAETLACDRKALEDAAPHLVPEGLSRRVKDVVVSRDDLWKALTGSDRKKK
jgi:hypothetical protein